ncbi:hypothetical protein WISP_29569 [Willisornis vidua]|uniref:Uncharacterized protein n=1 Tax=Willisornis vidua TaxID=1566151 RepID=A0ABQ9DKR2_9PASS|nr:hypothetical protein WISP_29569 [Willisornis vidua]
MSRVTVRTPSWKCKLEAIEQRNCCCKHLQGASLLHESSRECWRGEERGREMARERMGEGEGKDGRGRRGWEKEREKEKKEREKEKKEREKEREKERRRGRKKEGEGEPSRRCSGGGNAAERHQPRTL